MIRGILTTAKKKKKEYNSLISDLLKLEHKNKREQKTLRQITGLRRTINNILE